MSMFTSLKHNLVINKKKLYMESVLYLYVYILRLWSVFQKSLFFFLAFLLTFKLSLLTPHTEPSSKAVNVGSLVLVLSANF